MDQMLPTPGSELPKPERIQTTPESSEYSLSQPEVAVSMPETSGERMSQAASAVAQATAGPVATPASTVMATPATDTGLGAQTANPVIADDADVIEKEWVEKAKYIVAKTKDNPHEQSAELTSFKHDYIKKRYGRELQLPDDRAA